MKRLPRALRESAKWRALGKFEKKVLLAVYLIPKAEVRTYSQIAKMAGNANAARAAANAIAKNPFAPRIPCHRVVRSDGKIGGYSAKGGMKKKIALLCKEGVKIKNKRLFFA
jgi:methylated-DNA-[protein]-cysteine S-methyltransferase